MKEKPVNVKKKLDVKPQVVKRHLEIFKQKDWAEKLSMGSGQNVAIVHVDE